MGYVRKGRDRSRRMELEIQRDSTVQIVIMARDYPQAVEIWE